MAAWSIKVAIMVMIATALVYMGTFNVPLLRAQTDQANLMITWHAQTYVPPQYPGKAMPVANSKVLLAVDAVDSGKVVNLSSYVVLWYLNDSLLDGGTGVTHTTLQVNPNMFEGTIEIRVEIPDYGNGGGLISSIQLPVGTPKVNIETPSQNGQVRTRSFLAKADPYFFNITSPSQLNFAWTLDGQSPQNHENPSILNVSISNQDAIPGSTFTLGLTASNPGASSEQASQGTTLTFSP